jgi:hypothetical protein
MTLRQRNAWDGHLMLPSLRIILPYSPTIAERRSLDGTVAEIGGHGSV